MERQKWLRGIPFVYVGTDVPGCDGPCFRSGSRVCQKHLNATRNENGLGVYGEVGRCLPFERFSAPLIRNSYRSGLLRPVCILLVLSSLCYPQIHEVRSPERGVLVEQVRALSEAERAGIRAGNA